MDRETLRRIFAEQGFDVNGASPPHSWRCDYPDRYGDCTCVDEMIDAVMAELHWGAVTAPLSQREVIALRGDPGSLCGSDIAISGGVYFCDLPKDGHTVHFNEDADFSWSEV